MHLEPRSSCLYFLPLLRLKPKLLPAIKTKMVAQLEPTLLLLSPSPPLISSHGDHKLAPQASIK